MKKLLISISVLTLLLFAFISYSHIREENLKKEQFIKNLTAQMNQTYPDINKPIVKGSFEVAKN